MQPSEKKRFVILSKQLLIIKIGYVEKLVESRRSFKQKCPSIGFYKFIESFENVFLIIKSLAIYEFIKKVNFSFNFFHFNISAFIFFLNSFFNLIIKVYIFT